MGTNNPHSVEAVAEVSEIEQTQQISKRYLTVPNFLSASRAVFLPLLFYYILTDRPGLFLIGYIVLGSTDFFDGIIARKFNQKSEIGKALDSIADLFFYISTAWFLYALYPEYIAANSTLLKIFFATLGLSFVVSAIRCGKPILMHTFLLKLNAVLVYLLMIFSYFMNTTYMVTAILLIYLVGFAEEIYIFIKHGDIDPDTPCFWKIIK